MREAGPESLDGAVRAILAPKVSAKTPARSLGISRR